MSSQTTYQFLISVNVRALDIDSFHEIFRDQATHTSVLLELPLDVTFDDLTRLAKGKLSILFASDPAYWGPYTGSYGNSLSTSLQLMHKIYMTLGSDEDVRQALAFIKQRLFVDALVVDCTVTKQIKSSFNPMSATELSLIRNSASDSGHGPQKTRKF